MGGFLAVGVGALVVVWVEVLGLVVVALAAVVVRVIANTTRCGRSLHYSYCELVCRPTRQEFTPQ